MALNTQNKRRSAIAMPGITTPPVPDGSINAMDRRHMCDVPATVATRLLQPFAFWRKLAHSIGSTWVRECDTPPGG